MKRKVADKVIGAAFTLFEALSLFTAVCFMALILFNHKRIIFILNEIIKPLWGG